MILSQIITPSFQTVLPIKYNVSSAKLSDFFLLDFSFYYPHRMPQSQVIADDTLIEELNNHPTSST